jgi:two-component system phosphate regulon sensor histidine kinase PhoR
VQAPDQVWYANALARRLLDLDPAPGRLPAAAWRTQLLADWSQATSEEGRHAHYRVLSLGEERTLSWWVCALVAERQALVVVQDLSQTYALERSARTFLSDLSHELRTPLTAILAHVDLLRAPDLSAEAREHSLILIHQETARISRLVHDLITLSRMEMAAELTLRPLDLILLVEAAVAEVILSAEARHISLTFEAEQPLPRVSADADRLKQVVLNLLDNAIKYTRVHDQVVVRLAHVTSGVQVTVADTGPGIPPEHLPHLTRRFYRATAAAPGSGLGLAVAAEILRRHGSRLVIESANGTEGSSDRDPAIPVARQTGTTISFVLPAVAFQAERG